MLKIDKFLISKFFSIILMFFFYLVTLSNYNGSIYKVLLLYGIISAFLWIVYIKLFLREILENKTIFLWFLFIVFSLISTLIFKRFNGISRNFYEISFFFIIFSFSKLCDRVFFFKIFKNSIVLLAVINLLNRNFFQFLKIGTTLVSIDLKVGGGVSSIFEYRHYYGIFLVAAFFISLSFPEKNKLIHWLFCTLLLINIFLTFTIDTWLIFTLCFLLWSIKYKYFFKITMNIYFRWLIFLLILILFTLLFYKDFQNLTISAGDRILSTFNSSSSFDGGARVYSIVHGTKYILSNWTKYIVLGGGAGFALEWLKNNPYGIGIEWTSAIDVQYVSTLMEVGIIGLSILIKIFIINIKGIISNGGRESSLNNILFFVFFVAMCFFDILGFCISPFVFWNIIIFFSGKAFLD